MVGNDVVDLADSAARKLHPRFDARVFTKEERASLRKSGAPARLRWMLWAAKEAAYKVARKRDRETVFSPVRFAVELEPDLTGQVRHGDRRFPVVIEAPGEAVHAVARDPESDAGPLVFRVAPAGDPDASRAVRDFAVRSLAACLRRPVSDLRVDRRGRIPFLSLRGAETPVDLSLSHHGRFVAFACDLGRIPG